MQTRDTISAARSCLVVLIIGVVLLLIVCVVAVLGFSPADIRRSDGEPAGSVSPTVSADQRMIISVLDVGQGAAVVVLAPGGDVLVADAGRSAGRAEDVIVPYLRDHRVDEIDFLVATNPDQDHIGGMPTLLESFDVGAWVDPVVPSTNLTYTESLELVELHDLDTVRAREGVELDLGAELEAEILWPEDPLILEGDEPSHNDNSAVIKITYQDVEVLITGDIEERAEDLLVASDDGDEIDADILVVPHHGSKTSSSGAFLDGVSPEVAVIPVGFGNQYGHPHDEVVQRLRARGVRIYRTDLDGSVEIVSDGTSYQVRTLGPRSRS